jgi:hypothetical protein
MHLLPKNTFAQLFVDSFSILKVSSRKCLLRGKMKWKERNKKTFCKKKWTFLRNSSLVISFGAGTACKLKHYKILPCLFSTHTLLACYVTLNKNDSFSLYAVGMYVYNLVFTYLELLLKAESRVLLPDFQPIINVFLYQKILVKKTFTPHL